MKKWTNFFKGNCTEIVNNSYFSIAIHKSIMVLFEVKDKSNQKEILFLGRSNFLEKVKKIDNMNISYCWIIGGDLPINYSDSFKQELIDLKHYLEGLCSKVNLTYSLTGKCYSIVLEKNNSMSIKEISPEVVIVDDSVSFLKIVSLQLTHNNIDNYYSCTNPLSILELIDLACIKLILTDINMPELLGSELAKKINGNKPVLLMSGEFFHDSPEIINVLSLGNIDFINKKDIISDDFIAKVNALKSSSLSFKEKKSSTMKVLAHNKFDMMVIGASTGGVQTLEVIFSELKSVPCPIVIFIHMPGQFTELFTKRLNETYRLPFEHIDGLTKISEKKIYIAKGNAHYSFIQSEREILVKSHDERTVKGFCPNIDFSFMSLAEIKNIKLSAGILTGMGRDGAKGLLELKNMGFTTFSQDEASSIIYGMPKAASELKANKFTLNPYQIAKWINKAA